MTLIFVGCAEQKQETIPPAPTPPPAAVKVPTHKVPARPAPVVHDAKPAPKAPETEPPMLLSPAMAVERKDKMESDVTSKIRQTEQMVAKIDLKHLTTQEGETFAAIQNFLSKAKEALQEKDMPRALNLADKAQALAQDLPNTSGK